MNYAHSIPDSLLEMARADLPPANRGPGGDVPSEPSHAERARTLVRAGEQGFLSTLAREPEGFPFGSVVKHAVPGDGRILLCLSDLAEHSKNLMLDSRASLMFVESLSPGADPLAAGRVTLLGPLQRLAGEDETEARSRYMEAHPGAYFADFDDFHMYLLNVTSVRYVGGFGKMSWVSAEDFVAASPDPLRPHAGRIIDHMNEDHAGALVSYCHTFGSLPETAEARMTAVDRYGFDLTATGPQGDQAVRIPFGESLSTTDQVRARMVDMLKQARLQEG